MRGKKVKVDKVYTSYIEKDPELINSYFIYEFATFKPEIEYESQDFWERIRKVPKKIVPTTNIPTFEKKDIFDLFISKFKGSFMHDLGNGKIIQFEVGEFTKVLDYYYADLMINENGAITKTDLYYFPDIMRIIAKLDISKRSPFLVVMEKFFKELYIWNHVQMHTVYRNDAINWIKKWKKVTYAMTFGRFGVLEFKYSDGGEISRVLNDQQTILIVSGYIIDDIFATIYHNYCFQVNDGMIISPEEMGKYVDLIIKPTYADHWAEECNHIA